MILLDNSLNWANEIMLMVKLLTPCFYPERRSPKYGNPNHVDFPNTAIPNPLDDSGKSTCRDWCGLGLAHSG